MFIDRSLQAVTDVESFCRDASCTGADHEQVFESRQFGRGLRGNGFQIFET